MRSGLIAAACLAAFLILGLGNIIANSPTSDEIVHLAAGWTYLTTGDFRINSEHPPLLKLIAALPLWKSGIWPAGFRNDGTGAFTLLQEAWNAVPVQSWAQWFFSHRWLYGVRDTAGQRPTTEKVPREVFLNDPDGTLIRARILMLLVTGVGLAVLIFLWSRELWGPWGGVLSLALFCFDPNFIAHAGLVTTDVGVAMLMFGAVFSFWKFGRTEALRHGILFVLFFAAALLAKFSAVLLLPMIFVLILISERRRMLKLGLAFGVAILAGALGIWTIYLFRFAASENPLPLNTVVENWYARKEFMARFPRGLPAEEAPAARAREIGLLGRGVLLAHRNRLLPEGYLFGFALMQSDSVLRESYLHGSISTRGFRSYFFWTFLYKTPLPTIVAIVAAMVAAGRLRRREVLFLLIPAAIYLAALIPASINIGHRHVLPAMPFLYVICGALSRRWLVAAALSALSCLVVFAPFNPVYSHHLAYFNELAGGPVRGWRVLADSNVDWGQDLKRLRSWLDQKKIEEPINLIYFGAGDPGYYGIRYLNLDRNYVYAPGVPLAEARSPGWVAISLNHYLGINYGDKEREVNRRFLEAKGARLVGRAGYSILIYRLESATGPSPLSF